MYTAHKNFKLVAIAAQPTAGYDCSVVYNQQDFAEATNGDLIELWQPDSEQNRVLFQARPWKDGSQIPSLAPQSIGISDKVAKKVKLKVNNQTCAAVIQRADVAIDLLEVCYVSSLLFLGVQSISVLVILFLNLHCKTEFE